MTYFDDLVPDYKTEIPGEATLETSKRLLFMFKLAMNGHMVALSDADGDVSSLSPEFLDNFQWTLEEFQALEPSDFFHEKSLDVALIHSNNDLAAPYQARCYNKVEQSGWFEIQGVCVEFDGQHWRMLSFELL